MNLKLDINRVWGYGVTPFPLWKRLGIKSMRILHAIICDLRDGQLNLMAMSLVYTTIISLVPLLALCFSVLKGFGAHNEIKPMISGVLEPLGDKSAEITDKLVGFVDNIQVGVLGAVGLALLIYSVIAMMQKIERAFNYTWHVSRGRTFAQRFSDYLSVLLIGPLFLFLSVGMTTSLKHGSVADYIAALPGGGEVVTFFGLLVPYFVMGFAFAFIYFYMPNTKVNMKSAFVGGMVTSVIWKTMGIIFTAFVANSASHTAVYSAFASLIIFMIWMYLGWLVLLIGASVAYYHQKNPKTLLVREVNLQLSNRAKEKLGLLVIYLIAKSFYSNDKPWTLRRFAEYIDVPVNAIEDILYILEDAGIIHHTPDKRPGYFPTRSIDKTSVYEVMKVLRNANEHKALAVDNIGKEKQVAKIFADAEKAMEQGLKKVTLKDFVQK